VQSTSSRKRGTTTRTPELASFLPCSEDPTPPQSSPETDLAPVGEFLGQPASPLALVRDAGLHVAHHAVISRRRASQDCSANLAPGHLPPIEDAGTAMVSASSVLSGSRPACWTPHRQLTASFGAREVGHRRCENTGPRDDLPLWGCCFLVCRISRWGNEEEARRGPRSPRFSLRESLS
jgi:hypothetical protein